MSKPTPLSGFPELLPAARVVEREALASLARTFELHGYANIETRAVEPLDRLAKGGEIDKEIYVLRRLQADDTADDTGLGMHFDLTVPFARYVLENAGHLEFPFRRFQIQSAWRGERPQEGRYRQFTQADIDIVGRDELAFHHDVEVVRVMVEALAALPLPPLSFQVNNRKLIQGFYQRPRHPRRHRGDPADRQAGQAPRRRGGRPPRSSAPVPRPSRPRGASSSPRSGSPTSRWWSACRRSGSPTTCSAAVSPSSPSVLEGCADAVGRADGRVTVEANLRIARGLDYYTGTVVEIYMEGYERLKSVGGGGRYDALATTGGTTYPGVGISFGVSRTLLPLLAEGVLAGSRAVPSAVLVALADEEGRPGSRADRRPTCAAAASPARWR